MSNWGLNRLKIKGKHYKECTTLILYNDPNQIDMKWINWYSNLFKTEKQRMDE